MPAPSPTPLDRALTYLLDGVPEKALSQLLPLIETGRDPAAVLAAGQALAACAREEAAEPAERVLRAAVLAATRTGSFGLAVTACAALRQLERPCDEEFVAVARAFSAPRDVRARPTPPALEPPGAAPAALDFLELVDRVEAVCEQVARAELAQAAPGQAEVLCSQLPPADLEALARALEPRVIGAGEVIVHEGQPGRAAYFLARGEIEVVRGRGAATQGQEPLVLARLGAGSIFGEMALLSRSPRAASVVAVRPSLVLRGGRRALDEAAAKSARLGRTLASFCRRRMVDNLVRTSALLRPLRPAQRQTLLERFGAHSFERGEVVIAEGQEGAGLHLVASGRLRVMAGQGADRTHLGYLEPGDVVGEVGLVLRRPATAAVVAESPTVTLHLPAQEFLQVIRDLPELLPQLYELAVQREDETRNLLAQPAQDASDLVLF